MSERIKVHTTIALGRGLLRSQCLALPFLLVALPASAIPPPPAAPPQLRTARMTVSVQLIDASDGTVRKISKLCQVRGTIPVYADNGSAARANGREIPGCKMRWKGKDLDVHVTGAMAISRGPVTFATASVGVVPPDATPLCPTMCGPQPLADSSGEIKVSGLPRSLQFSLAPNPVSILNARPVVWLEADVAMTK